MAPAGSRTDDALVQESWTGARQVSCPLSPDPCSHDVCVSGSAAMCCTGAEEPLLSGSVCVRPSAPCWAERSAPSRPPLPPPQPRSKRGSDTQGLAPLTHHPSDAPPLDALLIRQHHSTAQPPSASGPAECSLSPSCEPLRPPTQPANPRCMTASATADRSGAHAMAASPTSQSRQRHTACPPFSPAHKLRATPLSAA